MEGDKLMLSIAKGVEVDPDFIAKLKLCKEEIKSVLREASMNSHVASLTERNIVPFNRETAERIPLSYAQESLWLIDHLQGSTHYHIPLVFKITGEIAPDILEKAFGEIVNRHESLRTVYKEENGKVYQEILPQNQWELEILKRSNNKENELRRVLIHKPFDLSKDHMLRVTLIKQKTNQHSLLVVIHHIAADGWSLPIIVNEFVALYNTKIDNKPAKLHDIKVQYADYALWERKYHKGDSFLHRLKFWEEELQGVAPLDFPTDFARPTMQSIEGKSFRVKIEKSLNEKLNVFSRERELTPNTLLLSVFKVLLFRYTQQPDIVVGTPVANRMNPNLTPLIGYFVNTLVLRNQLHSKMSFNEIVSAVKTTTLKAYDNQDVPFGMLVNRIATTRDSGHHPLFNIMFTYEYDRDNSAMQLGAAQMSLEIAEYTISKFDLTLTASETATGLELIFQYSKDLFLPATIARIANQYISLLHSAIANPDLSLAALQMLPQGDETELIKRFDRTTINYPQTKNIIDFFMEQVSLHPEKIAVDYKGRVLTYKTLDEKSNQLAWALKALGVIPNMVVGLLTDRSLDTIIGMLGILKAGGAYLPIEVDYPIDRITYMLENSNVQILISDQPRIKAPSSINQLLFNDLLARSCDVTPPENINSPHDLCYVIYTSGTTGKPKGVMVEHLNVVRLFFNDETPFDFSADDRWTMFHSHCFDFSVWEIYGALLHGGTLILLPKEVSRDPQHCLEILKEKGITILNQTPSAFYNLIDVALESDIDQLDLRYIIFGGEALKPSRLKKWREKYPDIMLINMFGITETTVHVTYKEIGITEIESGVSNIGIPIPTLSLFILDEYLKPVPPGVAGELYVGGAGVARGYINQEELTKARFIQNPFDPKGRLYRTGDSARLLPNGELEYIGRKDSQVKIRGYRIELLEIETALETFPGVRQAVAAVREDDNGNKMLHSYILGTADLDKNLISEKLKEMLPKYMIPSSITELKEIPTTPNGKVDRGKLPIPDMAENRKNGFEAPRNKLEKDFTILWQDLLNVNKIGINDNFFELGGDSIISIQLVSRAKKKGMVIAAKDIFDHQTIAELAKKIKQGGVVTGEQGNLHGTVRLGPIQQRFFEHNYRYPDHFNQAILFNIDKTLGKVQIQNSLELIFQHHDALRLNFDFSKQGEGILQSYGNHQMVFHQVSIEEEHELNQEIERICQKAQGSLAISTGDLVRFVFITTPKVERFNRLFIVVHHLAVDGVSWRILMDDLSQIFNDIRQGNKITLGLKTSSYRQWQKQLYAFAQSRFFQREWTYWSDVTRSLESLPVDHNSTIETTYRDTREIQIQLSKEHTLGLLQDSHHAYRTEIDRKSVV